MQANANKYKQIQTNISNCMQMWTNVSKYNQTQANTKNTQANTSKS